MSDLNLDKQQSQEPPYGPTENSFPPPLPTEVWGMTQNTYLMLMHLSQLLSYLIPCGGIVAPIVMWACNKDKSPEVDAQGKIILNWIISFIIYVLVSAILCLVVVGFVLLIALIIVDVVFPIIGAVKANEGTRWKYPLSIQFFKVD